MAGSFGKRLTTVAIAAVMIFAGGGVGQEYSNTIDVAVTFYDFHSDRTNPEFEQPHSGALRTGMVAETLDKDGKPMLGANPYMNHGIRFWFRNSNDLGSYIMASEPDPVVAGKNYLDKFRPIYFYAETSENATGGVANTTPADANPPAYRTTFSNEWQAYPITNAGQTPYVYTDGSTNGVTVSGGVFTANADGTITFNDGTSDYTHSVDTAFKNVVVQDVLTFEYSGGVYKFERSAGTQLFAPLHRKGFESENTDSRWISSGAQGNNNYGYTMELVREFVMRPALHFDFVGNGDAWIFIGPQGGERLVMDLGGIGGQKEQRFYLDDYKESLDLEYGQQYVMRMFYSERHSTDANILIQSDIFTPMFCCSAGFDIDLVIANQTVTGSQVVAGDSVLATATVIELPKGILEPDEDGNFPGTFEWSVEDITPGGPFNSEDEIRITQPGNPGGIWDPQSANEVYVYAERAHTILEVCVTYNMPELGNFGVNMCARVRVIPNPVSSISIEGTFEGREDLNNLRAPQPLDQIVIAKNHSTSGNFYVVLRDKFGNYISPATADNENPDRGTLAFGTLDASIATASGHTTVLLYKNRGQGIATRVSEEGGTTKLWASYTIGDVVYRDTVALIVEPNDDDYSSIKSGDRNVPTAINNNAVVIPSTNTPPAKLSVGSNPIQKSGGAVKIFASGKAFARGTLTVYDATGNVVRKINIKDNGDIRDNGGNRVIGEWDLRDTRGRTVAEGAYLVRGVVKTVDGKREKVSSVVSVR